MTYYKNMIIFGLNLVLPLKKIDSKPVYNKFFLKTKIKSYGEEAIDCHDKETPKVGSDYTCVAAITIDSAYKKDENCYPKCF